jgi:hypothetical protein
VMTCFNTLIVIGEPSEVSSGWAYFLFQHRRYPLNRTHHFYDCVINSFNFIYSIYHIRKITWIHTSFKIKSIPFKNNFGNKFEEKKKFILLL